MCGGGVTEVSFEPPSSSSCPQVCPCSYCDSELQQDRRPHKSGLNNVCPLLFLACLSSSALHRNLLASFVLIPLIQQLVSLFPLLYMLFSGFFCPPPPPLEPPSLRWYSLQCENAERPLMGCYSLMTPN